MTRHTKPMDKAELDAAEIDRLFDEGVDMTPYIDESSIEHPNLAVRKVNCALPNWVIQEAEIEARRLAVSRSAVLNMWLAEEADRNRERRTAA